MHLLARWHMPDHFQTRRGSTTWLQWMAVVAPALWLTLLWAMQLMGGVRRRRGAKRGVTFLHPLIQFALGQGVMLAFVPEEHWMSSWPASAFS